MGTQPANVQQIPRWRRFEAAIEVTAAAQVDPLRDVRVAGEFVAPSGDRCLAPGFWDGGTTWRVRFAPEEVGTWRYTVQAAVTPGGGYPGPESPLIEESGAFECVPVEGENPLYRHGPPRLAPDGRRLIHADGTPFFWLADTVWNGALLSTAVEWQWYVRTRREQGFTAAQYVTTQWRTAPDGGPDGPAFFVAETLTPAVSQGEGEREPGAGVGDKRSAPEPPQGERRSAPDLAADKAERRVQLTGVNPRLFRRLDARLATLVEAGIVGAPVLLWAIGGGEGAEHNPGHILSDADAILLARYQVARWHADPVVFILNGDGRYTGEHAERWRRIGRAVFPTNDAGRTTKNEALAPNATQSTGRMTNAVPLSFALGPSSFVNRAPVATHPGGRQWVGDEFRDEPWLDIVGYQSGHGDDEATWRWLVEGPPAQRWREVPGKAIINLEPCYEHHLAYHSRQPHPPEHVRRACYWSLLVTPTAGVTYGGHGVWGWDDGSGPPVAHPRTGVPLPWQQALRMPGAEQMRHLIDGFTSFAWWTLEPDQSLLGEQPGDASVLRYVAAARNAAGTLAALYLPAGGPVWLDTGKLQAPLRVWWLNPREGSRHDGGLWPESGTLHAPAEGDWLLVLRREET